MAGGKYDYDINDYDVDGWEYDVDEYDDDLEYGAGGYDDHDYYYDGCFWGDDYDDNRWGEDHDDGCSWGFLRL